MASALMKEEYEEKLRYNQDRIDKLTKENDKVKKELCKNKDFDEVKSLHQELQSLRRQSFEELISLKKERDDMVSKVQYLERELNKVQWIGLINRVIWDYRPRRK
jgi:chromosome segregation ATPase